VIMANRLPLEEQTGADLIYFNEAYSAFVLVQYKAMEKRKMVRSFAGGTATNLPRKSNAWTGCWRACQVRL